jgi:hypothetical protein
MASPEEALCTHRKKRLHHRKKLYVPTRRSDGVTRRIFKYPLEEAIASLEEAICAQATASPKEDQCTH